MPNVYCVECDGELQLPAAALASGLAKVRCPHCGARFQVFSGGVTASISAPVFQEPFAPERLPSPAPPVAAVAGSLQEEMEAGGAQAVETLHREASKVGHDCEIEELGLELIWIEPGSFHFGGYLFDRKRTYTLSEGFWLGKYPVTQGAFASVAGKNPSFFSGSDQLPVERVSWDEAIAFCKELNRAYAHVLPEGYRFSLPTEAQWEYACRAGTDTEYTFGDSGDALGSFCWFDGNSGSKTHPVGEKGPNAWGFYDMHGNVWEWCSDGFGELPDESLRDWLGHDTGAGRVRRGGSWFDGAGDCLSSARFKGSVGSRENGLGFRLALRCYSLASCR